MLRNTFATGIVCGLSWLVTAPAIAFPDGTAQGATDCGPCHGNTATQALIVTIDGPLQLGLGEAATYTVSIPEVGAGAALDVVVDGVALLNVLDGNTRLASEELVHVDSSVAPPTGNLGDWSYDFEVLAPDTEGVTTLTALLMQFDGDGDPTPADIWNVASLEITVPEPGTGVAGASALLTLLALVSRRRSSAG